MRTIEPNGEMNDVLDRLLRATDDPDALASFNMVITAKNNQNLTKIATTISTGHNGHGRIRRGSTGFRWYGVEQPPASPPSFQTLQLIPSENDPHLDRILVKVEELCAEAMKVVGRGESVPRTPSASVDAIGAWGHDGFRFRQRRRDGIPTTELFGGFVRAQPERAEKLIEATRSLILDAVPALPPNREGII
jgi:hypothetical protein